MRKQATVLYWRDYGGEKAGTLVQELQNKLGFMPSWEDCCEAAEKTELELPTGLNEIERL